MAAFAPDGTEALGRKLNQRRIRPAMMEIEDFYKLKEVAKFLENHEGYVALQLADNMLNDAIEIVSQLDLLTDFKCELCIVADSTFGEGDVDEVSAMHLECKKIVHFGDSNCKQSTKMDSFFVR
jgi:diphthamide biosynthesis enzyme Dph1/Dph2-like protein